MDRSTQLLSSITPRHAPSCEGETTPYVPAVDIPACGVIELSPPVRLQYGSFDYKSTEGHIFLRSMAVTGETSPAYLLL